MKLLLPVNEEKATMKATLSRVFGNAKTYLLIDTNTDYVQSIDNTFYGAKDIHIANDLRSLGVDAIITEKLCTTCHKNIIRSGIDVWKDDGSINVREAYNKVIMGGLFPMNTTNLTMHKMELEAEAEQYTLKQVN